MPDTTLRYLSMLKNIPPHPRKVSVAVLHERLSKAGFETAIRTVQRDLKRLSAIFPITCDEPARPAGWSWNGVAVDLPAMEPNTALTFALAKRFLEPLLPRSTLAYLTPYFRRAEEILGALGRSRVGTWPAKVRILPRGQRLTPARVTPAVLDTVYTALLEGHRFAARYEPRSAAGPVEYEVNPLGLVFRDAVVYLVCTLWNYRDVRHLALHRIREARPIDKKRTTPRGFDLDEYLASGEFGYPARPDKRIRLKVLFDAHAAQHLYETALTADQRLSEQPDGRVLLDATVQNTGELRWWLLGFGAQVEVLKPVALRREFGRIAERLAHRYGR